jgi:iron complex transport system ATP-binding protein
VTGISIAAVTVRYDGVPALLDLHAHVASGSWVGVIGPNGSGKSSLLRAIAGLVPFEGGIELGMESVTGSSRRRVSQLVAFVPQRPVTPDAMTVADYVALGRTPHIPYLGTESRGDLEVVASVLRRLDLDQLSDRPLSTLSGGEVQRAVLGRALAQRAPVLLLDEPTTALDIGHQQHVLELMDGLRSEQGLTVVSAMHDLTLAGQFADRLLLLAEGRRVAEGTPAEVLTEPAIRTHYSASVKVVPDGDGGILVVPTRRTSDVVEIGRTP